MQDTTKVTRARLAFACASTAILGVFGAGTAFAVSAHTTAKSGDQGKCEQGHGQGHDQGNCNGQGNGGGDDDGDGSGGGGGGGGGNPLQPVIDQVQQAVTDALSQVPQPPSGGGGGGGGAPAPTDCSTGGLSDATVAYQLYVGSGQGAGLDEADHPNAKQWNQQVESQAGPLTPAAHEVGCGIAALEALGASAPQPPAGLPVDPTTVAGQVTDAANGAAQTVSDATGGVVPNPLSH